MLDAAKTHWVINVGDANFKEDVLDRSRTTPVLVDFWAEWCGPCRQLGPLLEKQARERKGTFVLAKVNVDEAPQVAHLFQIESIPTVLIVKGGRPVNGFVGLVSEADLKRLLDELVGPAPTDPLVKAAELEAANPQKAEAIYRDLLSRDERNEAARVGLARVLTALQRDEEALAILETLPESGEVGAEVVRLKRTIEMRRAAAAAGDESELRRQIAVRPDDAKLRLELGNVLATRGRYEEALETLLRAAELDTDLGRGPIRELMVKIFEIIGVRSELADAYRRKLTALLY